MADDTVEAARRALDERLGRAFEGAIPAPVTTAIDALIAVVRAENDAEVRRLRDANARLHSAALTVVKLRDDETSPVAAPCAIAGACQYNDAYEIAKLMVLRNL